MSAPDVYCAPPPNEGAGSDILAQPTLTVEQAANVLGISAWALYSAIRRDDSPVPVIRCGRRILIASAHLRRLLGMDTGLEA